MTNLFKCNDFIRFSAYSVVDSWGNVPSAILNGNLNDLGSFPECFHIERNGKPYKTQYCIGHGTLFEISQHDLTSETNITSATVTIGLCLPNTCAVEYLEFVVNQVILYDISNMVVKIPKYECQLEENITDWKPIDFATM